MFGKNEKVHNKAVLRKTHFLFYENSMDVQFCTAIVELAILVLFNSFRIELSEKGWRFRSTRWRKRRNGYREEYTKRP